MNMPTPARVPLQLISMCSTGIVQVRPGEDELALRLANESHIVHYWAEHPHQPGREVLPRRFGLVFRRSAPFDAGVGGGSVRAPAACSASSLPTPPTADAR